MLDLETRRRLTVLRICVYIYIYISRCISDGGTNQKHLPHVWVPRCRADHRRAYVLEDEIVGIPFGCSPASCLLDRYSWEGKIPRSTVLRETGRMDLGIGVSAAPSIPSPVTTTVATHRITDLYPLCRPVSDTESVRCLRLKNTKTAAKFVKEAMKHFDDDDDLDLQSDAPVFRGLSLSSLELCLTFFVPILHSNPADNEFGPGIYATSNLEEAKKYTQGQRGDHGLPEARRARSGGVGAESRRVEQADGQLDQDPAAGHHHASPAPDGGYHRRAHVGGLASGPEAEAVSEAKW